MPKQGWCSQRLGKAPAVMVGNVSAEETLKEEEWGGEREMELGDWEHGALLLRLRAGAIVT